MDFQINSVNPSWPFLNWNGTFNWPMIRWKWKLLTNNWIKLKTIHQKSDRKWKLSTKNWPEMDNWSTRSIAVGLFFKLKRNIQLTDDWMKMKIINQELDKNENYRPKFDPKWIFHHWIPFKSIELIAVGHFNWNWTFNWPINGWKWKLSTKIDLKWTFKSTRSIDVGHFNRKWTSNWPIAR